MSEMDRLPRTGALFLGSSQRSVFLAAFCVLRECVYPHPIALSAFGVVVLALVSHAPLRLGVGRSPTTHRATTSMRAQGTRYGRPHEKLPRAAQIRRMRTAHRR